MKSWLGFTALGFMTAVLLLANGCSQSSQPASADNSGQTTAAATKSTVVDDISLPYVGYTQKGNRLCWAAVSQVVLHALGINVSQRVLAAKNALAIQDGGAVQVPQGTGGTTAGPANAYKIRLMSMTTTCSDDSATNMVPDAVNGGDCNQGASGPDFGPFPGYSGDYVVTPQVRKIDMPLSKDELLDALHLKVDPVVGSNKVRVPLVFGVAQQSEARQLGLMHMLNIVGATELPNGDVFVRVWDPLGTLSYMKRDDDPNAASVPVFSGNEFEIPYESYRGGPAYMSSLKSPYRHYEDYYGYTVTQQVARHERPVPENTPTLSQSTVLAAVQTPGLHLARISSTFVGALAPMASSPSVSGAGNVAGNTAVEPPTVSFSVAINDSRAPALSYLQRLSVRRKQRGFADAGGLSLAKPFPILSVGIDDLRALGRSPGPGGPGTGGRGGPGGPPGAGIGAAIFANSANVVVYPVVNNGTVVDSFLMLYQQGQWMQGGISNPGIANALVQKRTQVLLDTALQPRPDPDSFYLFSATDLSIYFLASGSDLATGLWTLVEAPDEGFTVAQKEPYKGDQALKQMARAISVLSDRPKPASDIRSSP
jgi:hypothetical protein